MSDIAFPEATAPVPVSGPLCRPGPTVIDSAASLVAAIFMALAARDGWPGSVIALAAFTVLAVAMLKKQPCKPDKFRIILGILSAGSVFAIMIEPRPLNLAMLWIITGAFILTGQLQQPFRILPAVQTLSGRVFLWPIHIFRDAMKISKASRQSHLVVSSRWKTLVLPLAAALVFAYLLAVANPIIDQLFYAFSFQLLFEQVSFSSCAVACIVVIAIWILLRTNSTDQHIAAAIAEPAPGWHTGFFSPAPVIATLFILNILFAAQNVLDINYVWSGNALPSGMTHAAYVHRGAATLIFSVLLAAGLMIVALWPGSRTEKSTSVRVLVYVWIIQNIFLVASCAARTQAYADDYGLTLLRLANLLWLALVAMGLLLIAARFITRRNNRWLIESNLAATFLLLWVSGFVDFRSYVASYNVERAIILAEKEPAIIPLQIDITYLQGLGTSSLPALDRLSVYLAANPRLRSDGGRDDTILLQSAHAALRYRTEIRTRQSSWRSWTWHGTTFAK